MNRFLVTICAAAMCVPGAASAAAEDTQLWLVYAGSGKIAGPVTGAFDVNFRFGDDIRRVKTTLFRGTIGVEIAPRVEVGIGYGNLGSFRFSDRIANEDRFHYQIGYAVGKVGPGSLSLRARLEQRHLSTGNDTGWRLRPRVRYVVPLKAKGPALVLQGEPFFALNSTDWGARAGFDQFRGLVGVSLPVASKVTLETGYQLNYLKRPAIDRIDHVIPVTLSLRF